MKRIIGTFMAACFALLLPASLSAQESSLTGLQENANSIVQLAETEVEYFSPTHMVCREKRVITVLNEQGVDAAYFHSAYSEKMSSLQKFSGLVTDASGRVLQKIKKSDLLRSEFSTDLATDVYRYLYQYTPIRYPFTIIYEWEEKQTDGILSLPTFYPQDRLNQSVAKASYRLIAPSTVSCRYKEMNGKATVRQETLKDGRQLTELCFTNLPAQTHLPYSLPLKQRLPYVYFAPESFEFEKTKGRLDNWQSFGKWQYALLQGREELPPECIQKLKELTANCTNNRERVQAVYDYLGKNTRYVSIQLGIGGLQPLPATEVFRTGFGDCKALTNYMHAMLTALDIPSTYTVISTENKDFLPDFASANQANHVILQVPLPEDTLWLECTNPSLPMGYVHHSIAGHDALLITPDGGVVHRLPTYADSLNTQTNLAKIVINEDGKGEIQVEQTNRLFQYEDVWSMGKLTPAKQKDILRADIDLIQADITNIHYSEQETSSPSFKISYTIHTNQYGSRTGKRLFIPLNVLRRDFTTVKNDTNRQEDIYIDYGYLDTDSIKITLPEGYELESFSAPFETETPFGFFRSKARRTGRTVTVFQQLYVKQGRYAKDLYKEFAKFRRQVANHYKAEIIIRKSEK